MVDTIANLATATAIDRATIAQLTATVTRITTEIATVNAKLVIALQEKRARRGGRRGCNRTSRGLGSGTGERAGTGIGAGALVRTGAGAPTMDDEKYLDPPIHYCWTCGPGCRHTSTKCPAPATGHLYTATKRNMQGRAETTKWHRRGEVVVNKLSITLNHHLIYTLVTSHL